MEFKIKIKVMSYWILLKIGQFIFAKLIQTLSMSHLNFVESYLQKTVWRPRMTSFPIGGTNYLPHSERIRSAIRMDDNIINDKIDWIQ